MKPWVIIVIILVVVFVIVPLIYFAIVASTVKGVASDLVVVKPEVNKVTAPVYGKNPMNELLIH